MQVKIKLHEGGILPVRATPGSAGFDLFFPRGTPYFHLRPDEISRIDLRISMEIEPGYEGQIRGRSGHASRGLFVFPGTIDADYRGSVGVIAYLAGGSDFMPIQPGMRIAQIVFAKLPVVDMIEVDELTTTERGAGGFGSTGA